MERQQETRAVLDAVYWSCMHGLIYQMFYGEREGNAMAASLWYVHGSLIPRCLTNIGPRVPVTFCTATVAAVIDYDEPVATPAEPVATPAEPAANLQVRQHVR